ncbi:hypothetical protein ACWGI8_15245 [Streptomyces sp. NPDC054841]
MQVTPVQATPLSPYARLPRPYRKLHIVHSTVDAYGRAHWLLAERPPTGSDAPYDALVVTVGDGAPQETHLSAVLHARCRMDALPDGGFVLVSARAGRPGEQTQVFDALGRTSWTFDLGDAVEHLLVDEAGDLWVGHFDENPEGIRRWSSSGELLWQSGGMPGVGWITDCYALNAGRRATWACTYTDFPLLEFREDKDVRVRSNKVGGACGFAVHGDRLTFFGGYGGEADRLVDCELTDTTVEPVSYGRAVRPDGEKLGRRRVVSRGPRVYVQAEPGTEWFVRDIGDGGD